ncbi:homocitrate synthase [Mycolicibacterium sp. P1-18]|uniref:alpha-isopropylmalate synthase regulatory domain-containing protein n=1 Tax=Mycolicibacterium sp. P1-18 TaxID=2024615 RepID=UPI0011F163A1|nr:alpha-isopropylmalate synthase regulatory domain-containing protein [Mycolicibacterium sp. P1-18]KAA0091454.1 homocitrate synthase [Mycolicibacterium sp. P1-18]
MSITTFPIPTPSFAANFRDLIPRALREEAESTSDEAFLARYAPSSGPLRLGQWQCVDVDRPASRLGPQARNYQATIAVADRIATSTAAASGPVAALTAMLSERGVSFEIAAFHQLSAPGGTATFIRGTDGVGHEWAVGWSDDVTQSALRAVIACANRLCA